MTQFIIKCLISGLLVALVVEFSKRSQTVGALVASLPITSLLAMSWLYYENRNKQEIGDLSLSIFWMVIPSLIFFIILPYLLRHFSFLISLALASLLTALPYGLVILIRRIFLLIVLSSLLIFPLKAHEGHDHGALPGEAEIPSGPIVLTEQAIQNLEIQSVEATIQSLQQSLGMPAQLKALPEKQTKLSVRFSGRVKELLVRQGNFVTNQQPLLKLEPSTLGNPPVVLRASQEGWITALSLTLGQTFSPEKTLVEITDYRRLLALGTAFETKDFLQIKEGQSAQFKASIESNLIITGKVQHVDAVLQTESKTFQVYVEIDNQNLKLRPNFQGTLFVDLGNPQDILAVPQQAILGELGNFFVFVQEGNYFAKRFVTLGSKFSDQIEILSGVLPEEKVVIQGNYQLQYATATQRKSSNP